MSRDWEGDGYDDWAVLNAGRFELNAKRVVKSKRGVQWLRDLEAALLALPQPRLCTSLAETWIEEDDFGERHEKPMVCAVGALALHKGVPFETLEPDGTAQDTVEVAENLGMASTLAVLIGDENDRRQRARVEVVHYGYNRLVTNYVDRPETPEERFERVLGWVRDTLEAAEVTA